MNNVNIKSTLKSAEGKAQEKLGEMSDDPALEAKGKAKQIEVKIRETARDLKDAIAD